MARWIRYSVCLLISALLGSCGGGGGDVIPAFDLYYSVAIKDLNNDGLPDVAACYMHVAGPPPHAGYVAVYLQDPAHPGTFLAPKIYSVGSDPVSIAIGDLDGDGKRDIVTACQSQNAVSVLLQDPASPGNFLAAKNYATGRGPNFVAIDDLNGDGKLDLAVADSDGISILYQDPALPGTFLPRTLIDVGGAASSVTIADLNGDGKLDLVVTRSSAVLVLLQDPAVAGTFLAPTSYSAGQQPYSSAVGDLNGDGKPDIAVALFGAAAGGSGSGVAVLLQDPSAAGSFLTAVHYNTDLRAQAVAIADLQGDGKVDLVVSNTGGLSGICPPNCGSTGTSISILFQDPAVPGQFQTAVNYPASNDFITWAAVDDMNGDGKPDVVIAQSGGIFIRFQDPLHPGQFLAATPIH